MSAKDFIKALRERAESGDAAGMHELAQLHLESVLAGCTDAQADTIAALMRETYLLHDFTPEVRKPVRKAPAGKGSAQKQAADPADQAVA